MKRKQWLLAALALVLVLGASIGPISAYFTTYAAAKGGYPIHLGSSTTVYEEFSRWTKHVTVTSEADSQPVYVRARAFWGETYAVTYDGASGWTDGGDGFWYYDAILKGGEATAPLDVHIENVPAAVEPGENFNIVVVYETTPVQYDEAGEAYADWSITLDTGKTGGDAQ